MKLLLLLLIPLTLVASEPKPQYKYKYLYPPKKSHSPRRKGPKKYKVPNNSIDASYILAANKERWPEIVIKTEKADK